MFELLIIDDVAENLRVLQSILQSSGYRIRAATSAEIALKLIDKQRPDLVISDIKMPGMTGIELCRQLVQRPVPENVPVILASAYDGVSEIEQAQRSGCCDILCKPYRPAEVLARVKAQLIGTGGQGHHARLNQAIDSLVDDLVVGVANEINTPLGTSILTATHMKETILNFEQQFRSQQITSAKLKDFIHFCHDSVDLSLNNLNRVTDMMSMFRSISASDRDLQIVEFNIVTVVEKVLGHFHAKLTERGIMVKIDSEPVKLATDPELLTLVFTNLIGDSLAHAYPDGEYQNIHLDWQVHDNWLELNYWDQGCGADEAVLSQITKPFFTTKRGRAGHVGLSATVTANIIQRPLSGGFQLSSDSERGLVWRIRLPVSR